MDVYQLRLFGLSGKIVEVQRISALDDAEALSITAQVIEGAESVATYDVWHDERHVAGVAPRRRPPLVRAAPNCSLMKVRHKTPPRSVENSVKCGEISPDKKSPAG